MRSGWREQYAKGWGVESRNKGNPGEGLDSQERQGASVGEGRCTRKLCSLIAGRQACMLGCKEYSMVASPFFSPFPNNGTLSLLWVQTFYQVPSVVAFHSPSLSVLLPPPVMHCFLIPHAVSTPPTPACSQGPTSKPRSPCPAPPCVSDFGVSASGSYSLCGSHSAF